MVHTLNPSAFFSSERSLWTSAFTWDFNRRKQRSNICLVRLPWRPDNRFELASELASKNYLYTGCRYKEMLHMIVDSDGFYQEYIFVEGESISRDILLNAFCILYFLLTFSTMNNTYYLMTWFCIKVTEIGTLVNI